MSNHIGFFNGTGVVSKQPTESKIKKTTVQNKTIEYFKLGFLCEGAFFTDDDDISKKNIEVERIVGVEKGFNWLPIQHFLYQYGKNAERIMKNSSDNANANVIWYRIPTEKTADAVILDKNNLMEQMNGLVADFCHLFNRNMGTAKKLHTKKFDFDALISNSQPEM